METNGYWDRVGKQRGLTRRSLLRTAGLAGAGLASIGLAGCASKSAKPASQPIANGTGQPQSGGTLNTYIPQNLTSLDYFKASGSVDRTIPGHMQSWLVKYRTGTNPNVAFDSTPDPDLALSWESPDAQTWTFKLQPHATFDDIPPVNGHPVEAEDVKASFVRALNTPQNLGRANIPMIDPNQIDTPTKDTVAFKLKYAYSAFVKVLAFSTNPLYPREALAGSYDPSKVVIGSGPFLLDNYTPDVAVTFKKNPAWFVPGHPYIDSSRVAIVADSAQQLAQFTAGNLDIVTVATTNLDAAKRENPKAQAITVFDKAAWEFYGHMNQPSSVFNDVRVRRAMSMAIDRDALGRSIMGNHYYIGGHLQPAYGKWAPALDQLGDGAQYLKYNPDAAKKLVVDAGAGDAIHKVMYVKTYFGPQYEAVGQAISNMLNAVGFKTQPVTLDYAKDWVGGGKGVSFGNYPTDAVVLGSLGGYTIPEDWLISNFTLGSPRNKAQVNDPTLDSMLTKMAGIPDDTQRLNAVHDIASYLAQQMYYVPTTYPYISALVQPRIKNYQYSTNNPPAESFTKLWIQG